MLEHDLNIPVEWLQKELRKKCGQIPEILTVKKIEEASHGYMSQIRRIGLRWPEQNEHLPSSLVVKAPSSESAADAWTTASEFAGEDAEAKEMRILDTTTKFKKILAMMHNTESRIFTLFAKQTPPISIPKTYISYEMSSEHPVIVMEDIKEATVVDIVAGFDEKQFQFKDEELSQSFCDMLMNFVTEFAKNNPEGECCELFLKHLFSRGDFLTWHTEKYRNDQNCVLVHGDMWSPQFLWRGGKLAAIVDWQLAHAGNFMEDLQHLLTSCVCVKERTRLTPLLLQYYYEQLCVRLAIKGHSPPFPFQRVQVLKDGSDREADRVAEILDRTLSIVQEAIAALGIV